MQEKVQALSRFHQSPQLQYLSPHRPPSPYKIQTPQIPQISLPFPPFSSPASSLVSVYISNARKKRKKRAEQSQLIHFCSRKFCLAMARPSKEAIDTFMSITGATEAVAVQRLEAHGGDLNEAVNAHFSEGDRNISVMNETSVAAHQGDFMDIDDAIQDVSQRHPLSLLSAARNMNPFSLLDPTSGRSLLDVDSDFTNQRPFVTHPRQVRQIPIEVKDGSETSGHSRHAPTIEDVTETAVASGPGVRGTVIIDDEEEEDIPSAPAAANIQQDEHKDDFGGSSNAQHSRPSAPVYDISDYSNDIEEEMVQAAIEASKKEAERGHQHQQVGAQSDSSKSGPKGSRSPLEDAELAHAVSLSLETAEQEKVLREHAGILRASETEVGKVAVPNGRLNAASSSIQDEAEHVEEEPLVRHRSRRLLSGMVEDKNVETSPPSSPRQDVVENHPQQNRSAFQSDEWGGISSEEHDEAVMLEAAMFGGIPEGTGYRFAYGPDQFLQREGSYSRQIPRPPSPSLAAQRLIREQQDDEYLASLQADQEKELKAKEEAEARRLEEEAAKQAALEEKRRKEEENRKKFEEEQELERKLAAKEVSLPREPAAEDENAVTLLVRMPDGSRRGRRFLKSDKLQLLFDFIDTGRVVKPGTYRVVRPYPRRAFSDAESDLTFNELGLTSKQEALFLELI